MYRRSRMVMVVVAAGLIGLLGFAAAGLMDEKEITLDQVPPAAQATIVAHAAGGQILEIEVETTDGVVVYEAEIRFGERVIEIEVAPDGTLLRTADDDDDDGADDDDDDADDDDDDDDERIGLDQLPPAAAEALLALAGDHVIVELSVEVERGFTMYEAAWMVEGLEHEAAVLADGTLVVQEHEMHADAVPPAVFDAAAALLPPGATPSFEMKLVVMYEAEAVVNGEEVELLILPTGEVHEGH
jgi:uncharacterized membrane protein YkoI